MLFSCYNSSEVKKIACNYRKIIGEQLIMPTMIIQLNYLISFIAFLSCLILFKKGSLYLNASKFMFFLGFASLLGGFVHNIVLDQVSLEHLISNINAVLPHYVQPIQLDLIGARLWYIAMLSIGFTEFYFMFLFMEPITKGHLSIIIVYLYIALGVFIVLATISSQYLFVVAFHVCSHIIIIAFSLYIYFVKRIKEMLFLIILACYNLTIGVIQQLMSTKILPSGPLHFNDWYHIGIIIFIIGLHLIFTKTNLIKNLNNIQP